jgi:hypothetical protein
MYVPDMYNTFPMYEAHTGNKYKNRKRYVSLMRIMFCNVKYTLVRVIPSVKKRVRETDHVRGAYKPARDIVLLPVYYACLLGVLRWLTHEYTHGKVSFTYIVLTV